MDSLGEEHVNGHFERSVQTGWLLSRVVIKDRLEGRDVARRLQEPAGEGMAQIVTPERRSGSAGDQRKAVGEACIGCHHRARTRRVR